MGRKTWDETHKLIDCSAKAYPDLVQFAVKNQDNNTSE